MCVCVYVCLRVSTHDNTALHHTGSRLYASIARSLFNEIISIDTNGKDYQVGGGVMLYAYLTLGDL